MIIIIIIIIIIKPNLMDLLSNPCSSQALLHCHATSFKILKERGLETLWEKLCSSPLWCQSPHPHLELNFSYFSHDSPVRLRFCYFLRISFVQSLQG